MIYVKLAAGRRAARAAASRCDVVLAPRRDHGRRRRARGDLRLPLLRGLRVGGLAGGGDARADARRSRARSCSPSCSAASSTRSASPRRRSASASTPPACTRSRGSGAPLNDLGNAYVGSGMAELLDAGAMLSALRRRARRRRGRLADAVRARAATACSQRRLSGVSEDTGAPAPALAAIMRPRAGRAARVRGRRHAAARRVLLPRDDRRPQPAGHVHRHRRRRDPRRRSRTVRSAPLVGRACCPRAGSPWPATRSSSTSRRCRASPLRPLPVRRRGVARDRPGRDLPRPRLQPTRRRAARRSGRIRAARARARAQPPLSASRPAACGRCRAGASSPCPGRRRARPRSRASSAARRASATRRAPVP